MKPTSDQFAGNVTAALANEPLQQALTRMDVFRRVRRAALDDLPEFEDLSAVGTQIRRHAASHLPEYLEEFERNAISNGTRVHWARDAKEASDIVLEVCRSAGVSSVVKSKSMVSEEVGLLDALTSAGFSVIETDIGEYILQLAGEPPSHLVAPALHKTIGEVDELFAEHHQRASGEREVATLVKEATAVLRERYLSADGVITGANFLVAETGSIVVVTNEGNGDLGMALARCHVAVTTIDKVIPTLADLAVLLRLLGRAAVGQEMTVYTTVCSGPRRAQDLDGPDQMHVVILDNGRHQLVGGEHEALLSCIRCGACMNHCPVYQAVGGQAYGWVYPGPIGAALTPALLGLHESVDLPNASTLCGACEEACPVNIPLPAILRSWRERAVEQGPKPKRRTRMAMALWRFLASRPRLYSVVTEITAWCLHHLARRRGRFRWLPFVGGWTRSRDLPAPTGRTFQSLWREMNGEQ